MRNFFIIVLISLAAIPCRNQSKQKETKATPWDQHGPLKVSENPHYLVHQDGTPFIWIGGTAWGITEWLNREEVDLYLENRKEKGINLIQLCLFWGKRHDDPVSFPVNPPNAYGHRAFQYTDSIPDPSKPAVNEGGDYNQPNDYWDHVDYVMEAAKKRGMYLGVLPVWGRRYVNATHRGHSMQVFNRENAFNYGKFLGERYGRQPHLVWVMGGDVNAMNGGDFKPVYRAMAEGIVFGITGKNIRWDQQDPAWDQVLMTYHPDGNPFHNSSQHFHQDPWLDFNMIETHVSRDDLYKVVLDDYLLTEPIKPTVMGEGHYEGFTGDKYAGPVETRRQAWQTFFAGATGFTYGAFRDSLNNGPLFSPFNGWQQMLDLEGVNSLIHLKNFLDEIEWQHWEPDTTVFHSNPGQGELRQVAITRPGTSSLAIYFPHHSGVRIKSRPVESDAWWINPTDGRRLSTKNLNMEKEILPPQGWQDAVLYVK